MSDVRHAIVSLGRTPAFTVTALVLLALGIGANTAVFSLVQGALLRPLPLTDPDRIVRIWSSQEERQLPFFSVSAPDYADWRDRARTFEALAAYERQRAVTLRGEAEQVSMTQVTVELFPLLGVSPALGRVLAATDVRAGDTGAAVISHGLWQRRFGGRSDVLGQTIALDEGLWTIVGVMPPSFEIPNAPSDVWLPLILNTDETTRAARSLRVLGRLRPSATPDDGRRELVAISSALSEQHPASNRGWSVTLRPLVDTVVSPEFRRSLTLLAGAIAFVLLMACANVTGLLLARTTARRREMAVRLALGASPRGLLRLLLVESLVLATAAGIAGVLLALWGIDALKALGAGSIPRLDEVTMNLPVLAFAAAVTLITAGVFGVAPALHASRGVADALRARDASAHARASRSRTLLIVVEVALAVVLLIGAGLMMRSFVRLQQRALGFDAASLLVAELSAPSSAEGRPDIATITDTILARLAALPGVAAAAGGSRLPFVSPNSGNVFEIEGQADAGGQPPDTDYRVVTTDYFRTLGIPLVRGRAFTTSDGAQAPAVIISEATARRYWAERDPLGARVRLGRSPWMTVVGIAGDARYYAPNEAGDEVRPMMYVPHRQMATTPMLVALRTRTPPETLADAVRATIRDTAPDVPIARLATMTSVLAQARGPQRFAATLLAVFAWLAVVLAAVGLYGLLAYLVSRRTKEIGVRMALGATTLDVVRLTAGRGVTLAAIGVGLGLIASGMLAGLMRSVLFEVSPTDPVTYVVVAGGFLAVTALASYLPARRALGIDPVDALRAE